MDNLLKEYGEVLIEGMELFGVSPVEILRLKIQPKFLQQLKKDLKVYEEARQKLSAHLEYLKLTVKKNNYPVISHIATRTKEMPSILEKMWRQRDKETDTPKVYRDFCDLCGARIIVNYIDDVYYILDALKESEEFRVLEVDDKIKKPLPSGYRGIHAVLEIPLAGRKFYPKCELQIRTSYQDSWSTKAHGLTYKKDVPEVYMEDLKELGEELYNADLNSCLIRDKLQAEAKGLPLPEKFTLSDKPEVSFSFVKWGTVAGTEEHPAEMNKIYLDVGNKIAKGVIDHHQDVSGFRSASEIVCKRPDLVLKSVQSQAQNVEIILHADPDFDAIASALLAKYLIREGELPKGAALLAEYASLVDQGAMSLDPAQIKTPFAAVLFLNRKISNEISDKEKRNVAILEQTLPLMETLMSNMLKGIKGNSPDSLDWDSEPLVSLIPLIEKDREIYMSDLEDKDKSRNTEILRVLLPENDMLRWGKVDTIFLDDPSCTLFKYWARGDRANTSEKRGFILTLVHYKKGRRTVISTDPGKDYFLPFLGSILEFEETMTRTRLEKTDKRLRNEKGELLEKRFNHNPDPWYDGRGHNFTILDSPRNGSLIEPERIRKIVANFSEIELFK